MRVQPAHLLLGVLLVVLAVVTLNRLRTPAGPSIEQLTETALHGSTPTERAEAAVGLSDAGPEALAPLRRVLAESEDPPVQAACLTGLAKLWDYESMELLLELMETGPPRVRGRAAQAFMRMTGRQRRYAANAPEAERRRLVDFMRQDWEEIAAASEEDRAELVRRLRESHGELE